MLCGEKKEDTLWRTENLILSDVLIRVSVMLNSWGRERIGEAVTKISSSDYIGNALAKIIDDRE